VLQKDKVKLREWLAAEYMDLYNGTIGTDVNTENVSVNLLFAIFSELRLIRELQQK
jgi:hypothetical protein